MRANALENNFRLYTLINGTRRTLASARVTEPMRARAWPTFSSAPLKVSVSAKIKPASVRVSTPFGLPIEHAPAHWLFQFAEVNLTRKANEFLAQGRAKRFSEAFELALWKNPDLEANYLPTLEQIIEQYKAEVPAVAKANDIRQAVGILQQKHPCVERLTPSQALRELFQRDPALGHSYSDAA